MQTIQPGNLLMEVCKVIFMWIKDVTTVFMLKNVDFKLLYQFFLFFVPWAVPWAVPCSCLCWSGQWASGPQQPQTLKCNNINCDLMKKKPAILPARRNLKFILLIWEDVRICWSELDWSSERRCRLLWEKGLGGADSGEGVTLSQEFRIPGDLVYSRWPSRPLGGADSGERWVCGSRVVPRRHRLLQNKIQIFTKIFRYQDISLAWLASTLFNQILQHKYKPIFI